MGILAGIFRGFFSDPQNKGSNISGKYRGIFRKKIRSSKKIIRAKIHSADVPPCKKRDVHKISACNSGAGNGRANFMGAWHFLVLSAGKPPCP